MKKNLIPVFLLFTLGISCIIIGLNMPINTTLTVVSISGDHAVHCVNQKGELVTMQVENANSEAYAIGQIITIE